MESLHLTYLKQCQKAKYNYEQFINHVFTELQKMSFTNEEIDAILNIKEKLSYVIYRARLHLINSDHISEKLVDQLNDKSYCSEALGPYHYLISHLKDKRKCSSLNMIVGEERKLFACLHDMEGGSLRDMQDIMNSMDYIEFVRLARYRKSCVIQHDVEFSQELCRVQGKFDMLYDALCTQLDSLRHHIYRVDRDSSGLLRVMRSPNDITEQNVDAEIEKCALRSDYLLFALRQWRAMSREIKHVFNNNSSIMMTMDSQIDTCVRYIEYILKLSFVMTRQPDSINVMQTPSTQRILREREFIKGSFLGFNNSWINISSTCLMYLVGLNEYKSSDDVFEHFSPSRKTAYEGDMYEPSSKTCRTGANNPQKFNGSDVCFHRVHMINLNLKRRCREVSNASNKRKHEEIVNNNAAPEEIFSFVLSFDISYDLRAPNNNFAEDPATSRRTLNIQTCSKPVAILVHASQKPQAEGKLFWCRFNPRWQVPLHEVTSVSADLFKKTLFEYTYDNFGRDLSARELDYLLSQIAMDQRQGSKIISKSVLKDEAQYTDATENPPKRKSFWCWFYDVLVFLCKGKGKSTNKLNTDNPLKKHWINGCICLVSRAQAQEDILTKLGSNSAGLGAVIRVSESKPKTLNVLSINDSWGVGEKEIDGLDQHLRSKFSLIWSECKQTWMRTDLVCETRVLDNIKYKPLLFPSEQAAMTPSTPSCMTPQPAAMTPSHCMSPAAVDSPLSIGYSGSSFAGSPILPNQAENMVSWNGRNKSLTTDSNYINPITFPEQFSDQNCYAQSPQNNFNQLFPNNIRNNNGNHGNMPNLKVESITPGSLPSPAQHTPSHHILSGGNLDPLRNSGSVLAAKHGSELLDSALTAHATSRGTQRVTHPSPSNMIHFLSIDDGSGVDNSSPFSYN